MKKTHDAPLPAGSDIVDSDWSPLELAERSEPAAPVDAHWGARAEAVHAKAFDPARGAALFAELWTPGGTSLWLNEAEIAGLVRYLVFAQVPAGAELIRQDERGEYLLVLLEGRVVVEQAPANGERTRLAEAKAGDMLGEMSLLDAGTRSSSCTARTACVIAVLEAQQLARMMDAEPRLASALLASLARRLSLRLRQASARLSVLLSGS